MKNLFTISFMILMGATALMAQTPHKLDKVSESDKDYWVIDTPQDLIWLSSTTDLDADNDATADFADIAGKMSANYRLGADIVFDTDHNTVDWNNDGTIDTTDALGLPSIGVETEDAFTGHFDGQYYTIENAYKSTEVVNQNTGLFANVDGCTIENLRLLNFEFHTVTRYNAGIVGYALDISGEPTILRRLWVEGILNSENAGNRDLVFNAGIVGKFYIGEVTECVAKVTGLSDVNKVHKRLGAIVGIQNGGSIKNCYSVSTLTAADQVGQIGGFQKAGSSIENCYAAGVVTGLSGKTDIGSFFGLLVEAPVSCYWDKDLDATGVAVGGDDVVGLTTAEFGTQTSFVDWDFENTWEMGAVDGVARPVLQWQNLVGATLVNIDAVYFAQTHVSEPDAEYFTLVGNRKTLIKAHVVGDTTVASPEVKAIVKLDGSELEIILEGPDTLPSYFESDIYKIQHSYDDGSFTGFIPKEWVKAGMTVEVVADTAYKAFDNLSIGSPTVLKMNLLEFACFEEIYEDFPEGWEQEFEARLPISELQIIPLRAYLPEIVMMPQNGDPAKRIYTEDDSKSAAATASRWMQALHDAAGTANATNMYYLAASNLKLGMGRGADFHGLGFGGNIGYLAHEGGHALGLAHCNQGFYPYDPGTYNGIEAEKQWVGPNWGFCLWNEEFIPIVGWFDGNYKKTPMLGGGVGDNQEEWALIKHFSDFEVNKMKWKIDERVVVWNSSQNSWTRWDTLSNDYTTTVVNDGVQYPIEDDVDVVSVLASMSAVTTEANIIYPPIGPYNTGLIRLFDPRNVDDRADIQNIYSEHVGGFDYTIKINQGGQEKYVMIPVVHDPGADSLDKFSFYTYAVNLPASDGEVSKVELLLTPDAEVNGLPTADSIVTVWDTTALPIDTMNLKSLIRAYPDTVSSRLTEPLFRVYPNPVSSKLTIENAPLNARYTLVNMAGKVYNSGTIKSTTMNLNVESYNKGVYILKVGDSVSKIIIE
jgi:hypothetical protein